MHHIYSRLRESARANPESQFVRLPVVPSLGMILSAADTTDVFLADDRLWHWFESYEDEHDAQTLKVDKGLVDRFGMQKAFTLACIADIWGLALQGVESWLLHRSRNPKGEHEDIVGYVPDRCPEGGWPLDKEACTEKHVAHARITSEPFRAYWTAWHNLDRDRETVAPRRLPASAAGLMALSRLSVDSWMELQDVVALGKAPFVPHWTRESSFSDEERYDLLVAAIWRGAVSWLMQDQVNDDRPFPYHPGAQDVIATNMVFGQPSLRKSFADFIRRAPYDRFCVTSDEAMISIATADGMTSFWYQERGGRGVTRVEGAKLLVGADRTGLRECLGRVAGQCVESFEYFRSDEPAREQSNAAL